MYRSYKTENSSEQQKNLFEERLVPKEVTTKPQSITKPKECVCEDKSTNSFPNIFGNIELDDIVLIGILILLLNENCEDNILIIVLLVLLFSK